MNEKDRDRNADINRWTETKKTKEIQRQTKTNKQTHGLADRQMNRERLKKDKTERKKRKKRQRPRKRQRKRQTGRQKHRFLMNRQTHRERQTY